MSSEIDLQIKDELLRDKIIKFYNKNKIKIVVLFLIIILCPILFQIYFYFNVKKKQKLISEYLRAEQLININETESLKILSSLKKSGKDVIVGLSHAKILEIYLNEGDYDKALKEINNFKYKFSNEILDDLTSIKKTIISFDQLNENEILQLLKKNQRKSYFEIIKKKLLYDFYIKSNQMQKANQINRVSK